MEIGIIGLPNVGKSTLFNALTKLRVPAENFPFTTIEPNIGVVNIPDENLKKLGEIFKPEKLTSATIRFVDIAGLVKGASKGEGLGNKFLGHIREMDALVQVLRGFKTENVVNTINKIDPEEERLIIETELMISDLEQLSKAKEKLTGVAKSGDKAAREKLALIEEMSGSLDKGIPLRDTNIPRELTREYQLLTDKPLLYVLNIDEGKPSAEQLAKNYLVISAKLESELAELGEAERGDFVKEMGIEGSAFEKLIRGSYKLLGLITFYTVVGREVRAWTLKSGTSALKAAGKIHTDMEKGFIRADVYNFSDLQKYMSEKALQEKGLVRSEGRDYTIKDLDIVKIHFK
jgi:ribosome-binding ATPase